MIQIFGLRGPNLSSPPSARAACSDLRALSSRDFRAVQAHSISLHNFEGPLCSAATPISESTRRNLLLAASMAWLLTLACLSTPHSICSPIDLVTTSALHFRAQRARHRLYSSSSVLEVLQHFCRRKPAAPAGTGKTQPERSMPRRLKLHYGSYPCADLFLRSGHSTGDRSWRVTQGCHWSDERSLLISSTTWISRGM